MGTSNGQNNVEDEMKQAIDTAKEAKKVADEAGRAAREAGKVASKIASAITFIISNFVTILQVIGISLLILVAVNIFQYIIEKITAQKTPEQIYETLGIEDIKELVQIVGNDDEGYHLEYVSDFDQKVEQIIEVLGSKSGVYTISKKDSDIIEKMIKAEIITQFPNLAGEYDEENGEFQGAVRIRRVTPNKEIGEMKNTGTGEVTTLGDEKEEEIKSEEKNEEKSNSKPNVKSDSELVTEKVCDLYKKGTYNIKGEKTSDSGVTLAKNVLIDSNTQFGEMSQTSFFAGKTLYYTGQYIVYENNTYLEVKESKEGEAIGYVKSSDVKVVGTKSESSNDNSKKGTETIGDENKEYVLAIAAGHNNTDNTGASSTDEFVEQDMTIRVAEKVEELCKKYSNIKVVQTGSTSENPGGVGKDERVQLAKDANPDLCIQIHFNASETHTSSGVETWYEYGDGYSEALAIILVDHMSTQMGLENRGSQTKENNSDYWTIIDSYHQTNFPSVITEGGFLDNENDQEVLRNGGIDKYAQAIVDGCIEYLTTDHSDASVTFIENSAETSGIDSKVYDLKYVSQSKFKELVDANSKEALDKFTLDDSFNVLTATWKKDGNTLEITENTSYNFRTALQDVTMPYEYLLYFLIDSGNKEFVRELAEMVENTEIIIAVQDNVTTTQINATVERKKDANDDYFDTGWQEEVSESQEKSSFTENCRTSVSITYADTWCVRYSRENDSYSAYSLGISKEEVLDKNNTIKVRGKVEEETNIESKGYGTEGPYIIRENFIEHRAKEVDAGIWQVVEYTYNILERYKKTIHTISNTYEEGEAVVSEKINKFVNLYREHKMANCVKESWLFQILEENTKTANMVDLTKYLIYKATGTSYGVEEFDFSVFDLSLFNNISASSGGISLTTSMFTKEVFVQAMQEYGAKSGNSNFNTNFLPYAEEIYDVSVKAGVNPELVVVTAKTEQNFKAGGGNYNYWGIGVTNGSSSGGSYSSLAEGIRAYADTLKQYQPGGKYAAAITQKYEERKASGCDPLGYGLPGTLSGMQSIYSYLGKHEYGSSGAGGYYYMDPARAGVTKIYETHQEFVEKCLNVDGEHAEGTETTAWEQGQYTAWQLEEKIEVWNEIFGAYGSLSSGGEFLSVAEEVWKKVCSEFTTYGGTSIPPTGTRIDCSSYVSWVLYEYGYTEYEGGQHSTYDFMNTNLNQKYGWEEISVGSGQNPINQLQPGDIFVRYGNGTHHMLIVKEIKDGRLLCYDCGDESNWLGKNGNPTDSTYFLTETGNGKIIRVTPPQ